jgi:hypothetical protein
MLSNIVGTLLAFVTIMLILSLIVTSLVQFAQATLRLRGRNLLVGVAALLKKYVPNATLAGNSTSPLRSNTHLALAAHVLNTAQASPKLLANPNATGRVLLGPPISWIPPDDLASAVASTLGAPSSAAAGAVPLATGTQANASSGTAAAAALPPTGPAQPAVQQAFEDMEPAIAKRFQFIIRIWTVAISFVIAFAFQLSTPDLLKNLPSQDAQREAILAAVPNLTNEATRRLAFSTDSVLEESIRRLSDKFPQYKELFEEVSGDGDSKQDMMDEMRGVLGKRSDREMVLEEYLAIIDTVTKGEATTAFEHTSQLINQLDTFGISPKLDNFEFYVSAPSTDAGKSSNRVIHWSNIVGVLITGILLSLGAPFWFEQLKNLSSLRDSMNPSAVAAKSK